MELPRLPETLYAYADIAREHGYQQIAGIDEAGRGPLAGPVVAAAVILPPALRLAGLNDSKQVRPAQRDALCAQLTTHPEVRFGIAVVEAPEIDRLNILRATCLAMRQAVASLDADLIFVDGNPVAGLPAPSVNIVKGDAKCASIAAASIIAKVHRDRLMIAFDTEYPGYGFARHKGYGTAEHLAALRQLGPCPLHRRSFAPVAACCIPSQDRLPLN